MKEQWLKSNKNGFTHYGKEKKYTNNLKKTGFWLGDCLINNNTIIKYWIYFTRCIIFLSPNNQNRKVTWCGLTKAERVKVFDIHLDILRLQQQDCYWMPSTIKDHQLLCNTHLASNLEWLEFLHLFKCVWFLMNKRLCIHTYIYVSAEKAAWQHWRQKGYVPITWLHKRCLHLAIFVSCIYLSILLVSSYIS